MKLTLKLFLLLSIFSSVALADEGNMGNGGKSCPQGQVCLATQPLPEKTDADTTNTDSILIIIQKYIISIFE